MPNYDLHCHSTVSDGTLAPGEVVRRAHRNGVNVLALTDHDGTDGIVEAEVVARELGISLIPGVEISVTWQDTTIHIVGLGVDIAAEAMVRGLQAVSSSRQRRGQAIAAELSKVGIEGSFQDSLAYAANPTMLSRAHFARALVARGYARDSRGIFSRFLAKGKPGYVPHQWASLEDAVGWIVDARGLAVIAHPGRYGLAEHQLIELLNDFKDAGGVGIEVLTGSHTAQQTKTFAQIARKHGLLASCGSDFHGPEESRVDLGGLPELAIGLKPVWERL